VDGTLRPGDNVVAAHSGKKYTVQEVGLYSPARHKTPSLSAGHVGYVIAGMKESREAQVGDTLLRVGGSVDALPGFSPAKAMVFASVYPVDAGAFSDLTNAVEKLTLNDPSVTVEKESSTNLGFGLRCGFLGLLHMDVFHQRLSQEFETEVISTAPMVRYQAKLNDGTMIDIEKPEEFPSPGDAREYYEPIAMATIIVPAERTSAAMALLHARRGEQEEVQYLDDGRVVLKYRVPWQEIVSNFFDELKSITSGYATFDYEDAGYKPANVVKVDILINGSPLDALAFIAHKGKAEAEGRSVLRKLRDVIRRQQFEIRLQAAVGAKIFAKERIAPFRKDVLTKAGKTVGGGDKTRKQKLLAKQKRGKARMKTFGNVQLSQEAFHTVMSR
jgi:GTP-binding protein LepA